MRSLLALVPLLGCGAMMFICMKMMGGSGRRSTKDAPSANAELADEVSRLRAEVASLRNASTGADTESTHG